MTTTADHTALVDAVLKRFGREPDLTLWRNSRVRMVRGQARAMPGLQTGASDIIGMLAVPVYAWPDNGANVSIGARSPVQIARFCAFEAKTGNARPTKLQRLFIANVRRHGGFACVFHSVEEFEAALERARGGGCE